MLNPIEKFKRSILHLNRSQKQKQKQLVDLDLVV